MTAPPDAGLHMVMHKVATARGFECRAYKESCLRRRIAVRMRARGAHTYAAYAAILDQDAREFDRLLDALTVNVSKFYRNADTWDAIAMDVLPDLWQSRRGFVRCWSAGCAAGEEPYTLAMLLAEQARRAGWRGDMGAWIDATDFDETCLARAQKATYRAQAFDEMPKALSVRYLTAGAAPERWRVLSEIQALVRFRRRNLTQQAPPHPPYDLILCRNVVIYFDRSTQEELFLRMADALTPGGYLVLGKVESLFGEGANRLKLVNLRERIYRRQ